MFKHIIYITSLLAACLLEATASDRQVGLNAVSIQGTEHAGSIPLDTLGRAARQSSKKYLGGKGDGFGVLRPSLHLRRKDTTVCLHTPVIARLQTLLYEGYNYEWYRVDAGGKDVLICTTPNLYIARCEDKDNGSYFCRVKDSEKEGYLYSDTLRLTVESGPEAKIAELAEGTTCCPGEEILLKAQYTDAAYSYAWAGEEIVEGAAAEEVRLRVTRGGVYTLTVSDGHCSSMDSVRLSVLPPLEVDAPDQLNLAGAQEVELSAWTNTEEGEVTWKWKENVQTGRGPVTFRLDESGVIQVSLQVGRCVAKDSVSVFMKEDRLFAGGDNDGYGVSNAALRVLQKKIAACTGEGVELRVTDMAAVNYQYAWYKVADDGNDQKVSGVRKYSIMPCQLSHAGSYYCVATSGNMKWYSDTLQLEIHEGPVAQIVADSKELQACYGEVKELSAGEMSVSDVRYEWFGADITAGMNEQTVTLSMRTGGMYVLRVSNAGCSTTDTVHIEVMRPSVLIPDVAYCAGGASLEVNAECTNPDTEVKWYVDDAFLTTSTEKVSISLKDTKETVIVRVEAEEFGCVARDTMTIFVKHPITFLPENAEKSIDDGFANSRPAFRVEQPLLQPCPSSDVVMRLRGDVTGYYGYTWYRVKQAGETADKEVAEGLFYEILKCTSEANGEYYCVANKYDEPDRFVSDTVRLTVLSGAIAQLSIENDDRELCYGEELHFTASPSGDSYTYRWSGPGVDPSFAGSSLIMRAVAGGQYSVVVSDGKCESRDTMTIQVLRLQVDLESSRILNEPQEVTFTAATQEEQVAWYIDDVQQSVSGREVTLNLTSSCEVRVEVSNLGCKESATCEVFMKWHDREFALADQDDGFGEFTPKIELESEEVKVCQGAEAVLAVKDAGYNTYIYKWYRLVDGKEEQVAVGRRYVIPEATTKDQGRYFCRVLRVNNVQEGEDEYWTTKEVTLFVKAGPLAAIEPLANAVCYGSEAELDASPTAAQSPGKDYVYTWSGPGADGKTGERITIEPKASAFYVVSVYDDETQCTDTVSIFVEVNHLAVEIPATVFLQHPQEYEIDVYNPSDAQLTWYIDGAAQTGDVLPIQKSCTVKVVAEKEGCTEEHTCEVIVRSEELYALGDDDGFAVLGNSLAVKVLPTKTEICTANELVLRLHISGEGLFRYQWFKEGEQNPLSDEKELRVPDVDETVAGEYYCVVTNLLDENPETQTVRSDNATVTFREGPKAIIGSPASGADICNGVEVTLDASASQLVDATREHTFEWFGEGADGLTGEQITFIPKGEMYVVQVSDGTCTSTDTVRLHMNTPNILIPEYVHLHEGGSIELEPLEAEGPKINWYVNGDLVAPNAVVGRFNVTQTSVVVAEVVRDVTDGTCSGYDTAFVYVKYPSTYTSGRGDDDGFFSILPETRVRQVVGETEFCRGTPLVRRVGDPLPEKLLRYEWRKVGSMRVIQTGKELRINRCDMQDAGLYYCTATALPSKDGTTKVYYSDTVDVKILPGPVAKITAQSKEPVICYRDLLVLDGSETEMNKYPNTDVYEYLWHGEFIQSPTLVRTEAHPENSGTYILEATNGVCTTYDTLFLTVNAPDVFIDRTRFIPKNGDYEFVVNNPNQNAVKWYLENTLEAENQDTVSIYLHANSQVIIEMTENGCSKTDTCFVFKKEEGTFLTGGGSRADDDGYYASSTGFYIRRVVSSELVCLGATSVFSVEVVGNDFYRYAWRKRGSDQIVSKERTFRIEKTTVEDVGDYYCEVTDVTNEKTLISEDVNLEVVNWPVARILSTTQEVCEGDTLQLRVDPSVLDATRNYAYLWSGNGTSGSRENMVYLTPQHTGSYILTVSDANCFDKDTIQVTVVKRGLKVPKMVTVNAGEDVFIRAEADENTQLSWRVNNVVYGGGNPLKVTGLKESAVYSVKVDNVCEEEVQGNIFVRNNAGYAGGEDDGFIMPDDLPYIIDHSPEVVGCGVDTASLFVELLKKEDNVQYIWEKSTDINSGFSPLLAEEHPNITGINTARIHFLSIKEEDEGRYRCRVKGKRGFVVSPISNLVKGTVPQIIGRMKLPAICEGNEMPLIITARIPGSQREPSYRWYYSVTPDYFKQLLPEADLNKPAYLISDVRKEHEGYYMVEAYNLCGSVSDTAFLEVLEKPRIIRQSSDTTICLESPVRLWVEAEGGGTYGYSLYQIETDNRGNYVRDIRLVYNGLNPWYDLTYTSDIDAGSYLWTVWNECDSTRHTRFMHLNIEHAPTVEYGYLDTTICIGTRTITLDARPNISAPGATTRYRWTHNGEEMTQTRNYHVLSVLNHADTGVYKCFAYNACPDRLMKEFRVHKKEAPLLSSEIFLESPSFCEGVPIEIEATYTTDAGEATLQWCLNGQPINTEEGRVEGVHESTLHIDSVIARDGGRYYLSMKNECGVRESNTVELIVDLPAHFAAGGDLASRDFACCLGDDITLEVTVTGKTPIQYTWAKDGQIIPGARSETLQAGRVTPNSVGEYCCFVQNECSLQSEQTCTVLSLMTPEIFELKGSGKYCGYEEGVELTLAGFESEASYQLYRIGSDGSGTAVGLPVRGSDVPEGGVLSFGVYPAGRYYAEASIQRGSKVCTIQMKGEAEIISDVTPQQFEFAVSDPICVGETNGNLTLRGSEDDRSIQYVLQRLSDAGEWHDYGRALSGTGQALFWNNMIAGIYRVEAYSTTSGCRLQMGRADTLVERPYPQVFDLIARGGDTTNCEGVDPDVVLELDGGEEHCSYTLWRDGESTGRTLTALPCVWDKVAGTVSGSVYSVEAVSQYGCRTEMGEVIVVEKRAPIALLVSGGGYYCTGETDTKELTIEGKTEPGVRYDIFRQNGVQVLTDTVFYGTEGPIVFELPKESASYYVRATDTLDGCPADMQNTFSIQEDRLLIAPIPDQTIAAGTQTSLLANIQYAVGTPQILWGPSDKLAEGETTATPKTIRLDRGQRYQVKVSDDYCTAEAEAIVHISGALLYTEIKLPDCLTDVIDTLKLCEGDQVNLCSWADGGEPPYRYRWYEKEETAEHTIGTSSRLSNYKKSSDGYIYLEVTTAVGQLTADSVWVVFQKNPMNNLVVENQGINCLQTGESVEFVLKNAEGGIVYALEYSADGRDFKETGDAQKGDGNGQDLSFQVAFQENGLGYYRLQAKKTYGENNVCQVVLNLGEIRRRPRRLDVEALGATEYCEHSREDSIRLQVTEEGVSYRLVNTTSQKIIGTIEGTGESILYSGYYGSGRYRVVAQSGHCTDTMENSIEINSVPLPLIGDVSGLGIYCTGGQVPNLVINQTLDGAEYTLYRDSVSIWETVGAGDGDGHSLSFAAPTKAGHYVLISKWKEGLQCSDTVAGFSLIESPHAVQVKESRVVYCPEDGMIDTVVKIYGTEPLVEYVLKDASGAVVGAFDQKTDDTLFCSVVLSAGTYSVGSTDNCNASSLGTFTVVEQKRLADLPLMSPLTECAGFDLTMGVQLSEEKVRYELYEQAANGVQHLLVSKEGTGSDLILETKSAVGTYVIRAVDSLGCELQLSETYTITPLPERFSILSSALEYCGGEAGVVLGISGTQAGVNYWLQHRADEHDDWERVSASSVIYGTGVEVSGEGEMAEVFSGKYKAGTYRIVTEGCHEQVMDGEITIQEIPQVTDIEVSYRGKSCVDSVVSVVLTKTEPNVRYVLMHNGEWTGLDTIVGTGRDSLWTLTKSKKGEYSVQAIRGYCTYVLSKTIKIGLPVEIPALEGIELLCENQTKTLSLKNADMSATYYLWGRERDTLFDGIVSGRKDILFEDVPAGDTYVVIAENQMCDSRSSIYSFDALELPQVPEDIFAIEDCNTLGTGDITLQHLEESNLYTLSGPNDFRLSLMHWSQDTVLRDMETGEYCLTVQSISNSCTTDPICKSVRRALPKDSIIQPLNYCAGLPGMKLNLSGSTYNVQYQLLSEDGEVLEAFRYPTKSFSKTYPAGTYIFRKENLGMNGGCFSEDEIQVFEVPLPNVKMLVTAGTGGALCEKGNNKLILESTEADVEYVLRLDGSEETDTVSGTGGRVVFEKNKKAGDYQIIARRGGSCEAVLPNSWKVNPVPEAIFAEGGQYCYDPQGEDLRGTEVFVRKLDPKAKYYFCNEEKLDSITGVNSGSFQFSPAGDYVVTGIYPQTGCWDTVGYVKIEEFIVPEIFDLTNQSGSLCGERAHIILSGSEANVEYHLYMNETFLVGTPLAGTGESLDFGEVDADGKYRIYAKRPELECGVWMNGQVVIANQLEKPDLEVRGKYCIGSTNEDLRIALLNPLKGWTYFLSRDLDESKRVQITSQAEVEWDSVGPRSLLTGEYVLKGINECGDVKELGRISVQALPNAQAYHIECGDTLVCDGATQELVLEGSEVGVSYQLIQKEYGEITNVFPIPMAGTGDTLHFGDYKGGASYYVEAIVDSSQCRVIIDSVELRYGIPPNVPVIVTGDQAIKPGDPIYIRIEGKKQPYCDYYLLCNGVPVDTIFATDKPSKVTFDAQYEFGFYDVISCFAASGCTRFTEGPSIAEAADVDIDVIGSTDTTICSGGIVDICIATSQKGIRYVLAKDGKLFGDTLRSTGERLCFAPVTEGGKYTIYALASNGVRAVLNDYKNVEMIQTPPLEVADELGYCIGGKGVEIVVKNTIKDMSYYLTLPDGGWTYFDGDGGDMAFTSDGAGNTLFKAGIYHIELDESVCPVEKDVKIVEVALPTAYALTIQGGSAYMCEYPEYRNLVLEGSQPGIEYSLCLRSQPGQPVVPVQTGTGEALSFTVQDTGVYYVFARSTLGEGCTSEMANEVSLYVPEPMPRFELSAVKNSYCDTAQVIFGSVKLAGSTSQVRYELYRDGQPTGQVLHGNGSVLRWNNLKGKPASLATSDADGYIYTVQAVHEVTGCTETMTGQVGIIEENRVIIKSQDIDQSICMGEDLTLHVYAGGGMLNYRWVKDGQSISHEAYYSVDSATNEHIGVYQCYVSNQCGEDASTTIQVNVRNVAIQNGKMQDLLYCESPVNAQIISTIMAENYEWYRVGSEEIIGDKQILDLPGATPENAEGSYVCYAYTTCGGVYDTCRLEFNRQPKIEWNGALEQILCAGSEYRLEVESRDSLVWYRNNDVLNVSGNVLLIDSLKAVDAALYSVKAINKCNATQEPMKLQTLFVDEPLEIISITDSIAHYCRGSWFDLKVETKPVDRVSYKWYLNGRRLDETGNIYSQQATVGRDGTYYVRCSNTCTELNMDMPYIERTITVVLDDPIHDVALDERVAVCLGKEEMAELKVREENVEGETYQWYYKKDDTAEYVRLERDTAILPIENTLQSTGYYYCDITNACATFTTNVTHVMMNEYPVVTGHLEDAEVCENSTIEYQLEGTGGMLTYHWMRLRKGSDQPELLSRYEANANSFASESVFRTPPVEVADDSCLIWCEITNYCSTIYSDTAIVRVVPNATLSFEQDLVTICEGGTGQAVVRLENGTLPVAYEYTFNDGEPILKEMLTEMTDTIVIDQVGSYELVVLRSSQMKCVAQPTAILTAVAHEPYTATLSGNTEGCVGYDAEFTVSIDRGEGPWQVEIYRESDGKPAEEMGEMPLTLTEQENVISFKPVKSEHYRIRSIVEMSGGYCEGIVKGTAAAQVFMPDRVSFKSLSTDVFSGCAEVDYDDLLLPTVKGGTYYIGGQPVENTMLPESPGTYHITYVTESSRGCTDSTYVELTRVALPVLTMEAASGLCPGESTDIQIHVDGTGPFTVVLNMKEITLENREVFYNNLKKKTDSKGNVSYNVFNNSSIKSRTYEIVSVSDKYGCRSAADMSLPKKVVTMYDAPLLKVEAMHPLYEKGMWTSEIKDFVIPENGTVDFRLTYLRGAYPWHLNLIRTRNRVEETFISQDYNQTKVDRISAGDGEYRFVVTDANNCRLAEELTEIRNVKYTETGYLQVKVVLEGAYSETAGSMISRIGGFLPMRGMPGLPDAGGGRHWIDWVVMELRKEIDAVPSIRDTLLLRSDGYVTDLEGNDLLTVLGEDFSLLTQNAYHVVIKHRNHLTLASKKMRVYTEPSTAALVDLTDARNIFTRDGDIARHCKELGRESIKPFWSMAVGNILGNSLISIANPNEIQLNGMENTAGYYLLDVNFDGVIKWTSEDLLQNNGTDAQEGSDAYIVYKNRDLFSEIPEK